MDRKDKIEFIIKKVIDVLLFESETFCSLRYNKTDDVLYSARKPIKINVDRKNCAIIMQKWYSVEEIIFNPEVMKALFGKACVGAAPTKNRCLKDIGFCNEDYRQQLDCYQPAFIHHMMQCAKIIGEGDDEVDYLYDMITNENKKEG